MADTKLDLPKINDPGIHLVNPTESEIHQELLYNSSEWMGALPDIDSYIRREAIGLQQPLTREGGLTPWALAYGQGESRIILCSCETIRKKALVVRDGKVHSVICHGVASVFCDPAKRGHGYASTMMKLLGERLRTWQISEGEALFSVLYSDIGKKFYSQRGWHAFPSSHVSLPCLATHNSELDLPETHPIYDSDLPALCEADEKILRDRLLKAAREGKHAVALVPDLNTIRWHQAREAFMGEELYGRVPEVKGAICGSEPGHRVWVYFVRIFQTKHNDGEEPNPLYILRLVVEDQDYADSLAATEDSAKEALNSAVARQVAAVLHAAQLEGQKWYMGEVNLWNPTSISLAAARLLKPDVQVFDRENDSITSLRWYGEGAEDPVGKIDWLVNEKYGWC